MEVLFKKLHPDAVIPRYAKPGDSGFDFYMLEDTVIPGDSVVMVPTGLAVAVPEGAELQIRMRSGAAAQSPLIIANAPGTVDSGYRGEVKILIRNICPHKFLLGKGERIAQGVIVPVIQATLKEAAELPPSERGIGGFGSTGK